MHAYSEIADALPLTNPEPEEELDEHGWRVRHVGVVARPVVSTATETPDTLTCRAETVVLRLERRE